MTDSNSHTTGTHVLDIKGLAFSLNNKTILRDINLSINAGEFTVLLGPNGAGKTSLFSIITQLYSYNIGSISLFGQHLNGHCNHLLEKVGVVFQDNSLDLDLSVEQNLKYAASLYGLGGKLLDHRIHEELERLDLLKRRKDPARQLNGGHRRRLELIRATLHQPKLLLLDEATVGLDPSARTDFVTYAHELCQQQQCAVLWASHLIDEVSDTDRVFILHDGVIQTHQSARELCETNNCNQLIDVYRHYTETPSHSGAS
jgi:ABC-2 type transport system ATP-binding protein